MKKKVWLGFEDETWVDMNPKIKAGWSRRGKQKKIVTPGYNYRKNFFITLFWPSQKMVFRTYNRRRSKEYISYLKAVLNYAKKKGAKGIILWVDHAPCHKTQIVKRFYKLHPELKIKFLPKKAPQLNPVEGKINKPLKSDICSNWSYSNINQVVKNGRKYLRRWKQAHLRDFT